MPHPILLLLTAPLLAHSPEPTGDRLRASTVAELAAHQAELHDRDLIVEGRVAWAACDAGNCLVELVALDGTGPTVLARLHGELDVEPAQAIGRQVEVEGHFYAKIYPRYRLEPWQGMGWRAGETLPEQVELLMMTARDVVFATAPSAAAPSLPPLEPWAGPVFDLARTEFELAGAGTGRKCLQPGSSTPQHSTGSKQELLFGLEGQLTVEIEGRESFQLAPGLGTMIPASTPHGLRNPSELPACYLFVTSQPAP